ncbi:hypothetical protein ACQPW1_24525 [Nocardia sp. CA-128927]|uniref:hypothetical protein n=1 Tax=Nocardia sp. CA-128927 TaxID=3239975 RepID=UPI003D996FAA
MTTYFLDRGKQFLLPHGELQIRSEGTGGRVRISVDRADRSETLTARIHQGHVVVSDIESRCTVAAFPNDGTAVFRDGTAVTLFVEVDGGQHNSDSLRVEVVQQDVSGLHRAELARLRPAGNQIEVSVRLPDELGPLARAACSAAHEILGSDQAPRISAATVGLAIDTTASMVPRIGDGSVTVLTELVTGVAEAASCDLRSVDILGPTTLPVDIHPVGDLAERVESMLRDMGAGIGLTTRDLLPHNQQHVVLVITDTPPLGRAAQQGVRHLVLAHGTPVPRATGYTAIDPGHLKSLPDADSRAPVLRSVVRGLLAALTTEDKEMER